jgi:hypothetical protein
LAHEECVEHLRVTEQKQHPTIIDAAPSRTREASVRRLILTAALLAALSTPALAEVRILASPGGEVSGFLELFAVLRQTGERIVIDGPCYSACTLVLSTIPEDRICVTRRAVLGFHAARAIDRRGRIFAAPEATRIVLDAYPAGVREWIKRRGGLTGKPKFLRGRELAAVLPRCS